MPQRLRPGDPRYRTTAQRGYGNRHKVAAQHLKDRHTEGTPCWWCNQPMYLAQGLHADHSQPLAAGGKLPDRLMHSWCNTSRGDGTRDDQRPALTGTNPERNDLDLGNRLLRWPS
jgi:hypothetical protein